MTFIRVPLQFFCTALFLDGPRLSEVSPLHATLNCGYRHHGCMCRSCVSQLNRRNLILWQYVASLTGRC